MPIDYRVLPINLITNYIWDLAKGEVNGVEALPAEVWDTSFYTNKPIFPIHENEVNLTNTSINPFIIYDYIFDNASGSMYEIKCEKATLTVVAPTPAQLYAIKNWIHDTLNKFDSIARSINLHINNDSIRFKYISCSQELFAMQELKQTERSFTPRFASTLTLYYEYTRS